MNTIPEDTLYAIALNHVPQVGSIHSKILLEYFGSAKKVFEASVSKLEKVQGIGRIRASNIRFFKDFKKAEQEISFITKYGIRPIPFHHPDYPQRLLNCADPPTILFYKGNADLNNQRIVSVIGTRHHTEYARQLINSCMEHWKNEKILIVSGLAYGVDAQAHKLSLANNLPTIGILAHGLDRIYPPLHQQLAKDMLNNGGLLTEFPSGTQPDKQNFPKRNRIVAGMADAVVVIETGLQGGSIITADLANDYSREVFAFPGKIYDEKSEGCNWLIKENKANLISHPKDLLLGMNWLSTSSQKKETIIPNRDLEPNEKIIIALLQLHESLQIDELQIRSKLNQGDFATSLLKLEMDNIIKTLPGKRFTLRIKQS